ncbi:hypothetical protein C8J57DRAFT_1613969 [Mycena rebaudengoi]|nr:hypothetical protein C8J57DRAFT_1613969 [Mycena rebaudengoi]
MATTWQLDVPGVVIHSPPLRDGYCPEPQPIAFRSLKFHPLGLFDLRRHLGALPRHPGIFERFRYRFIASGIAWFAAGACGDGLHIPQQPGFFSEFDDLRASLPPGDAGNTARKAFGESIRSLIFDLATLWDRLFGRTTLILHVEGTTVPNTSSLPEYIRCSAYLPPSFVADNPGRHGDIARIVQLFIESVGVPTVDKWRTNAHLRGWPLNQAGPLPRQNVPGSTLIPSPRPNSAFYTFMGRAVGELDALLSRSSSIVPTYVIPDNDDEEVMDGTIWDLMERAGLAETSARERLEEIVILQGRVEQLQAQLARSQGKSSTRHLLSVLRGRQPQADLDMSLGLPLAICPVPLLLARWLALLPPALPWLSPPSLDALRRTLTQSRAHRTTSLRAALLLLIMRGFDMWKWHEELENLGLDRDTITALLAAMGQLLRNFSQLKKPSLDYLGCSPIATKKLHQHESPFANCQHIHHSIATKKLRQHEYFQPSTSTFNMPTAFTTVAAVSSARIHINTAAPKPQAARSWEKLKLERKAREEKQRKIDAHCAEWRDFTRAKIQQMAVEFDMKERYFEDLFFQGGVRMVHQQQNLNPYNAFKNAKAEENREAGISEDAREIHRNHIEEYEALSQEEKNDLVTNFAKIKADNFHLRRDTPRAKIQDIANVVRNATMMFTGLAQRVGVEVFFCVVRNNADFFMEPQWFFTCPALENYMQFATAKRWDTGHVGAKLEAFAITGCDPANLLRTAKQKAEWIKGDIRRYVHQGLVEITKDEEAKMAYTWFEEDIVQRYGVVIDGWVGPFINPSTMSTSLGNLRALSDALKMGECKFRKLTTAEAAERKAKWDTDVTAGRVTAKHRAERSDRGVPRKKVSGISSSRKRAHDDDADDDDRGDNGEEPDAPESDNNTSPPPKKRARKAREPPAIPTASKKSVAAAPAKARKSRKAAAPPKAPRKTMAPAPRDDEITQAARQRIANGRRIKSRAIVTSDDEEEADPHANEVDDTAGGGDVVAAAT